MNFDKKNSKDQKIKKNHHNIFFRDMLTCLCNIRHFLLFYQKKKNRTTYIKIARLEFGVFLVFTRDPMKHIGEIKPLK